jgi:hypothetical protein
LDSGEEIAPHAIYLSHAAVAAAAAYLAHGVNVLSVQAAKIRSSVPSVVRATMPRRALPVAIVIGLSGSSQ